MLRQSGNTIDLYTLRSHLYVEVEAGGEILPAFIMKPYIMDNISDIQPLAVLGITFFVIFSIFVILLAIYIVRLHMDEDYRKRIIEESDDDRPHMG